MQLLNITARAHPLGNCIDLFWELPGSPAYPRVRVVRRAGTHPTQPNPASPEDGIVLQEQVNQNYARDEGLRGVAVYYYSFFPYKTSGPNDTIVIDNEAEQIDPHNRAVAMATAPYNFAGQMYGLLPAIYHRYDTILPNNSPSNMPIEDMQKGQLLRFLALPGLQLDQLYSFARAVLNFYNLDQVDGRLLPLLAQTISWRTDYNLDVDKQRNEIRFAPYLYKTIGLIPTVEATVKRVTGWESRTKEFVHNVARTNQPERLNLWSVLRDAGEIWEPPVLISVNWAYEGRPAAVRERDDSFTFFYHTYRRHGWDIWSKRFKLETAQWQPSEPIVDQPGMDKHPTAVLQKNILWLFWESYDPMENAADRKWRIRWRIRRHIHSRDVWSSDDVLFSDEVTERRLPTATIDNANGLWLFWLERIGMNWQVKYNFHNGTAWELSAAASLPLDGDPRVEDDLLVFFANNQLWLFWARYDSVPSLGQTRWSIVYRVKQGLDPADSSDWSDVRLLPKAGTDDFHDREPTVRLTTGGDIELFWSSNRSGNWSIWESTLNIAGNTWSTPQQITNSAYSERAPLVISDDTRTWLVYRSNQSLEYTNTVYSATRTLDARYAGTTTFDTRNSAKRALRGQLEDFQTYISDAGRADGRTNDDRIARDTIGLYLETGDADLDEIKAIISRLNNVLPEFMPVAARAVFIP